MQFVAKHRRFRIEEIAKFISTQDYDIITLQEVWVGKDLEYIKEAVQHKLPYCKYFYRYYIINVFNIRLNLTRVYISSKLKVEPWVVDWLYCLAFLL